MRVNDPAHDGNLGLTKEVKGLEAVVPNPKLKLLNQVREVMRLRH